MPIIERINKAALDANTQNAANAFSWTVGGAVAWRFLSPDSDTAASCPAEAEAGDEECQLRGSTKNLRVFQTSSGEQLIAVAGMVQA